MLPEHLGFSTSGNAHTALVAQYTEWKKAQDDKNGPRSEVDGSVRGLPVLELLLRAGRARSLALQVFVDQQTSDFVFNAYFLKRFALTAPRRILEQISARISVTGLGEGPCEDLL